MYRGNAQTQAKVILNHEWTRKNAKRFSYWFTGSQGSEPECDPRRSIDDTFNRINCGQNSDRNPGR
jgi:hypothetical protein